MDVKQLYQLVNNATSEIVGESALLKEDLSNLVDVGTAVFNASAMDKYVEQLVNHIGKVIFVNRAYRGGAPSVLMDGWEFGSVLEKVRAEMPQATENESWNLQDGTSYDTQIFYQPVVRAKFFNSKITFEVDLSFTELQVKQSFSNAEQLNGFISMLYNEVEKSLTVKVDSLIMRTINNFIGETLYDEYSGSGYNLKSGVRAINLLYLYNTEYGTSLTKTTCLKNKDFIRYAVYTMSVIKDRIAKISTLYNMGGTAKFTPSDLLHVVLLSDFKRGADVYLQSDTFHDEYTALINADTIPYWQGSGTDYAIGSITKINITTKDGHDVEVDGIIGCMFDRDALGVCNVDRRVTTSYNAKAEFYTNYYKFDASYFNDFDENFIVFFVQ